MSLFDELKRRKVFRVGIAYLAVAWLLLQIAEILLPAYGYSDVAIRYLVAGLAIGLVFALVLAWVFDWTRRGLEITSAVDESESKASKSSSRAPNTLIAAFVVLAALTAAGLTWNSLKEIPRTERTIAVLPFATLGQDQADIFTDGMHLGVLTRLAEIHDLDVISRTSSMRFHNSSLSLPEIAGQLGADWVLNAEVQQGNEEVLVSVRLSDAHKDRQVWAENYRRTLTATNLFEIQGEIARRIINQLKAQLTDQEDQRLGLVPTENLNAYRLYQLGRSKLDGRSRDDIWAAVDLFAEALEEDPDYALAHAGLADAMANQVAYGHESGPELLVRAGLAADRALQLDADLAEAWVASGMLAYLARNLPTAISQMHRAIESRPSFAQAHASLAYYLALAGHDEQAMESARRAVALNPLAPEAILNFAMNSLHAGNEETALSEARRALLLAPGFPSTRLTLGLLLFELERYREAVVELRELSVPWAGMAAETLLALSLLKTGQEAEAEALFQLVKESNDAYAKAVLTAVLEGREEGYRLLEAMEEWPDWPTLAFIHDQEGVWNPEGDDPRFEATLRRIDRAWGMQREDQ